MYMICLRMQVGYGYSLTLSSLLSPDDMHF